MWLKPKAQLGSVLEITPGWLRQRGLRGVMVDLDNTLVPYRARGEPRPEIAQWLEQLHHEGIQVFLVSNARRRRLRYWASRLALPGIGMAGKPWFGFRRALRRLGLQAHEVAAVGDQLFTDILGGNLVGAYTVLVPPLAPQEMGYTRLVRRLERWVLHTRA